MKSLILIFLVCLSKLAEGQDVVNLRKEDFGATIIREELAIVNSNKARQADSFALSFGLLTTDSVPCRDLAIEYGAAAAALREMQVLFAAVNCEEEADLCMENKVISYPAIRVFKAPGSVSSYRGIRKAEHIASEILKHRLPPVSELNEATLEYFVSTNSACLIARLRPEDGDVLANLSQIAVGPLSSEIAIGFLHDRSIPRPTITLYTSFGRGKSTFENAFDRAAISRFVQAGTQSSIADLGQLEHRIATSGAPVAQFIAEHRSEREHLRIAFDYLAKEKSEEIVFAMVDGWVYAPWLKKMGIDVTKLPAFVVQRSPSGRALILDQEQEITPESIEKFLEQALSEEHEGHEHEL